MTSKRIAELRQAYRTYPEFMEALDALEAVTAERDAANDEAGELEEQIAELCEWSGSDDLKHVKSTMEHLSKQLDQQINRNESAEATIDDLRDQLKTEHERWRKMRKAMEEIPCLWDNPAEPCVAGDECKRCQALRIANEGVSDADLKPEPCQECAKLREALEVYADEKNWQCPRCKGGDHLNCFMGHWIGPVILSDPDAEFHFGEGHGYDIARAALTSSAAKPGGGE
jgi:DNA repair exonuclease SbcCD ATPase subunit